jgi:hypothetical protein
MCYYTFIVYSCLDSVWGEFIRFCRKGEALSDECGLRLATRNITEAEQCSICLELGPRYRQRQAAVERFKRWERESSFEPKREEEEGNQILDTIKDLEKAIRDLQIRRILLLAQDDVFVNNEDGPPDRKRRRSDAISPSLYGAYYYQRDDDDGLAFFIEDDDEQGVLQQSFDTESSLKKVLCPYFLRHPLKHQKGSCMGPGFDTISRLKYVFLSNCCFNH